MITARFGRIERQLSRLVVAPSFALSLFFVYGFILFTAYLSLTNSKIMPVLHLVGFGNYVRIWALPTWKIPSACATAPGRTSSTRRARSSCVQLKPLR